MLLLSLLAGLALADIEQCVEDSICGKNGQTLEKCGIDTELKTCKDQAGTCATKLASHLTGTCKGPQHGGSNTQAGIVYGPSDDHFFLFAGHSFKEMHDKAHEDFGFEDNYGVAFTYHNEEYGIHGSIRNDADLQEISALFASFGGMMLELTAERDTFAPTMPPVKPWARGREVYQKYGAGLADGADTRRPVGDPNQKAQRKMSFRKLQADTMLRLHWDDNIRAHNNGAHCYWELMVDGKRCPGEKWIRGGLHSQGNNNNDHQTATIVGLCAGIAAGDHTFQVDVYGNNRDCYTGWDPESNKGFFMMEVREVKSGMYGYYGLTDRGKVQGEDNKKFLTGRELSFTKEDHESDMRLFYYDNFRVYGHGKVCTWWIEVDGKDCKGGRITQSAHTHGGENDHTPQAMAGYCVGGQGGLQGGNHKMTIRLETTNGGDCYTGWESSFHMEAVEVQKGGEITYYQRYGNNSDGRDNGYVDHRTLEFTKVGDAKDSHLRLFYSDNLRVHGHGKWCRWELRIDDKQYPCSDNVSISGSRYVVSNQNDHFPHVITGYCKGIMKGKHNMKVYVRGNSADCYTGWDGRSNNNFVMEVQELPFDVFRSGPY